MTLSETLQRRGHTRAAISAANATGIVYDWLDDGSWQQSFVIACFGCNPNFGVRITVRQEELQRARFNVAEQVERQAEEAFERRVIESLCPHWTEYKLTRR